MHRIFLLSPAFCGGKRAQLLFRSEAKFDLGRRLQAGEKIPIGDIFSFLSGLYFRGKIAYAQRFGRPPAPLSPAFVITAGCGLVSAESSLDFKGLTSFRDVPIDYRDDRYRRPLERD